MKRELRHRLGLTTAIAVLVLFPAEAMAPPYNPIAPPPADPRPAKEGETMTPVEHEQSKDFQKRIFLDLEEYWNQTLQAWGVTEDDAPGKTRIGLNLVPPGEFNPSACGVYAGDPRRGQTIEGRDVVPGFYCKLEEERPIMHLSESWMAEEIQGTAGRERFGPEALAVVVAHEFAHHIQQLLGIDQQESGGKLTGKEFELQADCLAGTWANSAYYRGYIGDDRWPNIYGALQHLAGEKGGESHGTGEQRRYWFGKGVNEGNPSHCKTHEDPNAQ